MSDYEVRGRHMYHVPSGWRQVVEPHAYYIVAMAVAWSKLKQRLSGGDAWR